MKTYEFEGKEYVGSGEHRRPLKGEIFRFDDESHAKRASIDFEVMDCYILIPKEASMKYKQTDKKFSRMSVWEAMTDTEKGCDKAISNYAEFDATFYDYSWRVTIPYEGKLDKVHGRTRLREYLQANSHLYSWLVRHGFLEEVKLKRMFLSIQNPSTAIGEGVIIIEVVDASRKRINGSSLFQLTEKKELAVIGRVDKDIGIPLTSDCTVKILSEII